MSVVIETTIGDITVDLYLKERPNACLNFLKLCRIKYYNLCIFYKVERNFIAQTGDPTATGRGGESVFSHLYGEQAKYFDSELKPRLKHEKAGTLSMVNNGNNMNGSQFFLTLGENLTFLDEVHTVFGEVVEGFDVLLKINEAICDPNNRPYQDIRITHTVVLHDPYDDPSGLQVPDSSPVPTKEQLESGYIGADEEIDDTKGKNVEEIEEKIKDSEAKARATILEMVGDLPDADVKPPENVLFVCKLNPVTTSEDLEVIFSRFGKIVSCEVIKDRKSGDSLQYAFVEFEREEDCENAYFKMDNVLIDDRRIHVDFSQSVSKMNWEKEAKAKLKGLEKGQKFTIKGSQRKSDGYDMVFDMDNTSANRKDNRKPRVRSSDRRDKKHNSDFYSSGNKSNYSEERHNKVQEDQHHSNSRSKYYSSSERSKNGRNRDVEFRNHVSRSPYKKISPRKSQRKSDSSDRSVSMGKTSKKSPKHVKKFTKRDRSSSSESISPNRKNVFSQISSHKKDKPKKQLDVASKFTHSKNSSKTAPPRHQDKKKRMDSSSPSSSSDSPSPVRKSSKSVIPHSSIRSRSTERTKYKKRSSKHSRSPKPLYQSKKSLRHSSVNLNSRSKSPEAPRKTSKHKSYNKRESSSSERLRISNREYSIHKSLDSGSKYHKEQISHKNSKKCYTQCSDDSSDTNYKSYKGKVHKSSATKYEHTSRTKHSSKERKRRRRSSS